MPTPRPLTPAPHTDKEHRYGACAPTMRGLARCALSTAPLSHLCALVSLVVGVSWWARRWSTDERRTRPCRYGWPRATAAPSFGRRVRCVRRVVDRCDRRGVKVRRRDVACTRDRRDEHGAGRAGSSPGLGRRHVRLSVVSSCRRVSRSVGGASRCRGPREPCRGEATVGPSRPHRVDPGPGRPCHR